MTEPIRSLVPYEQVSTALHGASDFGSKGKVVIIERYAGDRRTASLHVHQEVRSPHWIWPRRCRPM